MRALRLVGICKHTPSTKPLQLIYAGMKLPSRRQDTRPGWRQIRSANNIHLSTRSKAWLRVVRPLILYGAPCCPLRRCTPLPAPATAPALSCRCSYVLAWVASVVQQAVRHRRQARRVHRSDQHFCDGGSRPNASFMRVQHSGSCDGCRRGLYCRPQDGISGMPRGTGPCTAKQNKKKGQN